MEKENRYKILVVDDEQDLCDILMYNLHKTGFDADYALSAEQALTMNIQNYNLILLDIMMDGISGFELARILKKNSETKHIPIIFLTAKDAENDKVNGLNLGADDYVPKPYSINELIARIRAVLRRRNQPYSQNKKILSHENLLLNANNKTVSVMGKNVPFTKTEFEILWLLLSQKGTIFSRHQLIDNIWPKGVFVTDRTVDVNITRIRKKIEPYSASIHTRTGVGYYFGE